MTTPTLPPLSTGRVDAIEAAVFGRIADERRRVRRRRRNIWTGIGAAAAVVVVAAVVGPSLGPRSAGGSAVTGVSGAESFVGEADGGSYVAVPGQVQPLPAQDVEGLSLLPEESATGGTGTRDIVATASSTVEVDHVRAAIDQITSYATALGGYVESSQLGGGVVAIPYEGSAEAPAASSENITVRVPADTLQQAIDGLRDIGDITATTVNRSDVTEQTVDLRARVAAGEASVARLTELMAQAGSVSDLITAESALAERQAQLDSDRQVLQSLESQVALSSLSVQLIERTTTVTADPAGFGDGLATGWNGLVATLNGIVIGVGFLLPWIVVGGVAWAVVWGVRRAVRRRRAAREG